MNLRYIIRDGEKVLQYCTEQAIEEWVAAKGDATFQYKGIKGYKYTWHDIPLCDEETGEEME